MIDLKDIIINIDLIEKNLCRRENVSDLVEQTKQLQKIEQSLLINFVKEAIDPIYCIPKSLDIIKTYNDLLTKLNKMHLQITRHYLTLSQQDKRLFMRSYLKESQDVDLYDAFISSILTNNSHKFSDQEREDACDSFKSETLKLLGTQRGYENLSKLNNYMEQYNKINGDERLGIHRNHKLMLTFRNQSSLVYQASRFQSPIKEMKVNVFSGEMQMHDVPQYINNVRQNLKSIENLNIKNSILINKSNPLILLYPISTYLNEPIIKLAYDGNFHFMLCPRFISLHHEINHMVRMFDGFSLDFITMPDNFSSLYKNLEEFAAIEAENELNKELNLPPRIGHSGIVLSMSSNNIEVNLLKSATSCLFSGLIVVGLIKADNQSITQLSFEDKLSKIQNYYASLKEPNSTQNENRELPGEEENKDIKKLEIESDNKSATTDTMNNNECLSLGFFSNNKREEERNQAVIENNNKTYENGFVS